MPDVIYMNGTELIESSIQVYQQVSSMTPAEAQVALNASQYLAEGEQIVIISFPMLRQAKEGVVQSGQSASQVWAQYAQQVEAGVSDYSFLGAAAVGAYKWAQGVLFGDPALSGTLAGAGGLLTMSLPAAAALAAPILGVAIGAELYRENPSLWEKISRTLRPYAYMDKETVAMVVDQYGQAFMPKGLIEALKSLFIEEGIGEPTIIYPEYSSDVVGMEITSAANLVDMFDYATSIFPYEPVQGTTFTIEGARTLLETLVSQHGTVGYIQYISRNGVSAGGTWLSVRIFDGYEVGDIISSTAVQLYGFDLVGGLSTYDNVAHYRIDRIDSAVGVGAPGFVGTRTVDFRTDDSSINATDIHGFPEGTSEWNGDEVDLDSTPTIPVYTGPSTTMPYFPVTLPIGDPTVSNDPLVRPDPTSPVELPELDPFIAPITFPEEWPQVDPDSPTPDEQTAPQTQTDPIYVPEPDLNPDTDPSAVPDIVPTEPSDPPDTPPYSRGDSPPILFPPPMWPSVVPTSGPGLVRVYNPTPSQFVSFGQWLWVTYADATIDKIWNNPFDGIIGAHELYATPSKDGTDTIRSGFLDSHVSSIVVANRYTTINCGSMVIPEYYGNYLDYAPYSKAYVYLPFIGIVEVEVDDIVGHAVNITYHVDSYSGSCIAQITVAKEGYSNTVYQYSGNCSVDLPLAGGSQAALKAGLISSAAYAIGSTINGIISGGLRGGAAGALVGGATGAIGGIANGVANMVSQKSSVQHSGSFGASFGAMGIKKPYIIIRRPVQKTVVGYQRDYGFPAHKRVVIGACTGFLRVKEVNVQSTLATDDEKARIEELLKSGVYVS